MSSNPILRWRAVGKIVKEGTEVVINAATETQSWKRPNFIADARAEEYVKAVKEDPKPLPKGTDTVCIREAEHTSENDQRNHITGVALDKNGNHIATLHFEKKG